MKLIRDETRLLFMNQTIAANERCQLNISLFISSMTMMINQIYMYVSIQKIIKIEKC